MNMKQTYFNRFILLIAIFSSLLLATGCCRYLSCDSACNADYAKQAKQLEGDTTNLTLAIGAVIRYPSISEGLSDEQILQYVYSTRPEFGTIFSNKKVSFKRVDESIEVTVYADDRTTALIIDNSSTIEADYLYKCK
jgi:hypothetical protein